MASQADIAASTPVSAEKPILDLSCMSPGELDAASFMDIQRVIFNSTPPRHLLGVDRYEAVQLRRDFFPWTSPAEKGAPLREAEAVKTDADGAVDFIQAEGTRVLVDAALCARSGYLLKLDDVVIMPPIVQASVPVTSPVTNALPRGSVPGA